MKWTKNPVLWVALIVATLQLLSTTVLKDNLEAVAAVNAVVLAVGAVVTRGQVYSKDTVQKELTADLSNADNPSAEAEELQGLVEDVK